MINTEMSLEVKSISSCHPSSESGVPTTDNSLPVCRTGTQDVACCMCGTLIPANPTGKCSFCLTSSTDITEGIERNLVLPFCRHCNRYQRPPWLKCDWESKELLALCLKRIRGLQASRDVILVDASFLYTEPHSRRIKIKLTLQKEVVPGAVIEHSCVVEYVIQPSQCDDCKRAFTPHTWVAVVQIRQKVHHKRSLMYLEQVILKHDAHQKALRIVEATDGLDAEFASKSNAQKFADFVCSNLFTRVKTSKQLVSHDPKSNTAFYKSTISVDICTICKDDLVFIPPHIANSIYGGISNFLLCLRATSTLQFVDPFSLKSITIAEDKFWKYPFSSILTRCHLTTFIVLNVERIELPSSSMQQNNKRILKRLSKSTQKKRGSVPMEIDSQNLNVKKQAASNYARALSSPLVEVEVARLSDFGTNDLRFTMRTHLGDSLHVGDHCLGYDLLTLNLGGLDDESGLRDKVPGDIIIVKKARKNRSHVRPWLLKRLPITVTPGNGRSNEHDEIDMEQFKCDLEEDAVLRKEVNLYKNPQCQIDELVDANGLSLCDVLKDLSLEENTYSFT